MAKAPRVTVLMTVYNGTAFLKEAIESVLNQTLADFEFLIIDDASTDGSVSFIRQYTDPRVRLICNERNIGQAPSLNRGLQLARGEYVARLDQDDICLPDRFKKQVALLDKKANVAVCGSLMIGIDAQGRQRGLLGRRLKSFGGFVGCLLLGICPVCHPSVMFRRSVVVDAGSYDESFAPAEDVELWVRLASSRLSAEVIMEPLVMYRLHDKQQSSTKRVLQQKNIRRAQEQMINAFCPFEERFGVTQALQMDRALWRKWWSSKDRLVRVFVALGEMLEEMQQSLDMSLNERADLTGVINRWMGFGVPVGRKIAWWPSVLWYPAVWSLSPLLVPNVRTILSRLSRPVRLVSSRLSARRALVMNRGK